MILGETTSTINNDLIRDLINFSYLLQPSYFQI